MFRSLLILLFISLLAIPGITAAHVDDPVDFPNQFEQLAAKCDALKLPQQATITRQWIVAQRRDQRVVYPFQTKDYFKPLAGDSQLKQFWWASFMKLRRARADHLFQQAKVLAQAEPAQSYRLLHEVLHEDYRHAAARKILNYSDSTVFLLQPKPIRAKTRHAYTDWEANDYYRVSTPHFDIYTDSKPADGVKIARQVERLYSVWQQLFVEFWCDTAVLAERFNGSNKPLYARKRHQIILFSSREEYQGFFKRRTGATVNSVGFYAAEQKHSFLFVSDPPKASTWLHEVTHQLFFELGAQVPDVAAGQNIWAIEGVAMYMESFREHGHFVTVGGFESYRLQFARYRKTVDQFYLPLQQLTALGNSQLSSHVEIRRLYSQCVGLAHFLMDADNGKYRDPFFQLLRKIYTNTSTAGTLRQLSGRSFEELDAAYAKFLVVTDAHLGSLRPETKLKALCLAHGQITNQGLQHLSGQGELNWLDLTRCEITDDSSKVLVGLVNLNQLSLESTKITDKSMAVIGALPNLEELDLSLTQVGDAGVLHLKGNNNLTVLWLTGTKVSDDSEPVLITLANLELLELTSTAMSASTIQQVFSVLPKLKP
ncbi:MAG: DUF1570 domain-containing protein [Planctomycetaceae bacterium]|jgi:hypothetical protein|nr:DUF1570 domain-containing protein [Planctomycetaceae bacterium]MBT7255653.1 DUF1570 domain-containing protein [Planctomycetaceae bacterium]MBT7917725.1 DUF1570 domain-containing protein [Planctomycetaceae bacterium]